jgi:hypothetical protein
MSRIAPAPGDGLSNIFPDAALARRYTRLASETTGTVRRILLKLAHQAQARHHLITVEVIDLHVVPNTSRSSPETVRTYA